jgi:tRNA(fMet)-specific endonuclease VapC
METKQLILCDSGVLIEYFRGNQNVLDELDFLGFSRLLISSVTAAEIYFGMKKREKRKTVELINKFNIYHVDKEISLRFLQLMLSNLDNKIAIPDAIIAATALTANVKLYTFNRKDFDYIEGLKLYNPKFSSLKK